jgi:chorismate dehydratase
LAGLESESGVDFVALPPARLIEQLRAGHLDAALVSSVEAARLPGYRAPAGLGIACKREIRSVRAFRRRGVPIRNIGIDEGSATSVALLRILLARRYADEMAPAVGFTPIAPTTRPDELPHDLVLLIGDAGLAADPGSREVWDLGQQWRALTGLPFVFALWLLRPGADADAILPVLQRARQRGRALGPVDGTAGAAHYELDAEDLRGVQRFWDEAQSLGLATAARPTLLAQPLAAST